MRFLFNKISIIFLCLLPLAGTAAEVTKKKSKAPVRSTATASSHDSSHASSPDLQRQLNQIRATSGIEAGRYVLIDPDTPNCYNGFANFRIAEEEIIFELGPGIKLVALQQREPQTIRFEADLEKNIPACSETTSTEFSANKIRFSASGDCWGGGWSQVMEIIQNKSGLTYTSQLHTGVSTDAPEQQTQVCRYRKASR